LQLLSFVAERHDTKVITSGCQKHLPRRLAYRPSIKASIFLKAITHHHTSLNVHQQQSPSDMHLEESGDDSHDDSADTGSGLDGGAGVWHWGGVVGGGGHL
jgi:hypothetical protein